MRQTSIGVLARWLPAHQTKNEWCDINNSMRFIFASSSFSTSLCSHVSHIWMTARQSRQMHGTLAQDIFTWSVKHTMNMLRTYRGKSELTTFLLQQRNIGRWTIYIVTLLPQAQEHYFPLPCPLFCTRYRRTFWIFPKSTILNFPCNTWCDINEMLSDRQKNQTTCVCIFSIYILSSTNIFYLVQISRYTCKRILEQYVYKHNGESGIFELGTPRRGAGESRSSQDNEQSDSQHHYIFRIWYFNFIHILFHLHKSHYALYIFGYFVCVLSPINEIDLLQSTLPV